MAGKSAKSATPDDEEEYLLSKLVFFAYESGHPENRDAIARAITDYNAHQKTYRARSWEELRVGGQILNATVLKAIEESEVFCCDLTYRNHNVLFELGYAIGKNKDLLVLLNPTVAGAKETYSASRILKNIGYDEFKNGRDIQRILQQHRQVNVVSLDSLINMSLHEIDSSELLFLSSPVENQAALDLGDYIQGLGIRIVQNNSSEVEYQTLAWYVAGIVKSRNVLIHLLGKEKSETESYNAEYSLFAGLSCGMGKSVMLLAPRPFRAPIDYSDILIEYDDATDCILKTSSWLEGRLRSIKPATPGSAVTTGAERELNLLRLGIGYETAEEEEENLLDYFIEIDTYQRAIERKSSIITGRKGAGKTALFIRLREHLTQEHGSSFNIVLKPESDELLDNVELTDLYGNPKTKRALLTAVWRLVFYSCLFTEIQRRILSQNISSIEPDSVEDRVLRIFETNKDSLAVGHFSAMVKLYRAWGEAGLDRPEALEQVYRTIIGPIADVVKVYVKEHKYSEINILADNLDKTWDAGSDLRIQAEMILTLLEFSGRVPQELGADRLKLHVVLILRTDIYEFISKCAREPDKLEARRIEVDWGRYPNRLREVVEARFRFVLQLGEDAQVDDVWRDYFSLPGRRHPFEIMREVVVPRPRDLIYFVSKLFESALNSGHNRVDEDDFGYAIEAYSNFLHRNMIAETRAEFPEVAEVVSEIQAKYYGSWLPYVDFRGMLRRYGYSKERVDQFVDFLFGKSYMVAVVDGREKFVTNRTELASLLGQRRFLLFRRHRARVLMNPGSYRLRSGGYLK